MFIIISKMISLFCLQNQLRLAYEIVKGERGDIDPQYSENIQQLVSWMLQKNAKDRPSAEELLTSSKFTQIADVQEMEKKVWELNTLSRKLRQQSSVFIETVPIIKSKITEVFFKTFHHLSALIYSCDLVLNLK